MDLYRNILYNLDYSLLELRHVVRHVHTKSKQKIMKHMVGTYMNKKAGSCTADLTICPEATEESPFSSYSDHLQGENIKKKPFYFKASPDPSHVYSS